VQQRAREETAGHRHTYISGQATREKHDTHNRQGAPTQGVSHKIPM